MSVINQMLNGLEERGVQVAGEQVRPVREERTLPRFKIIGLVLVVAAGVWFWSARPAAVAPVKAIEDAKPLVPEKAQQPEKVPQPEKAPQSEKIRVAAKAAHSDSRKRPVVRADKAHAKHAEPRKVAEHETAQVKSPFAAQIATPPVKQISPAQQADGEYRRAIALMQQGHNAEAKAGLEEVLHLDAGHVAARQALVAMLLEGRRGAEAEQLLQEGLKVKPEQSGFAMLLARLQVQRNDPDQAIATLERNLPHAQQQAEYQAFYAALLQRKNRHSEAVEHYQIALKSAPDSGVWLTGCAISLQALSQTAEAKEAYQRALNSGKLTPELQAFVQQKLKGL